MTTEEFLETYRRAFADFDAEALADMFAYPCQLTSDAGEIEVTSVPTREAWLQQVERLVAAYRSIGVEAIELVEARTYELSARLAQVVARWALKDEAGAPIYELDAAYTLALDRERWLITAVAHNETLRLRKVLKARLHS